MKYAARIILIALVLALNINGLRAQDSLRLESLLEQARTHYPLLKQHLLADEQTGFTIAALNRAYLPQTTLNAQASTQSDVTALPFAIPIPGIVVEPISTEQYRAVAEINQLIYDGGTVAVQKDVQRNMNRLEHARIDVELQKLRERVRQLFLGLLMSDRQLAQAALVDADLKNGIKTLESAVKNGTAFRSQLSQLQAELLRNKQRIVQLESARRELLQTLSLLSGMELDPSQPAAIPFTVIPAPSEPMIARPELRVFNAQDSVLGAQRSLIGTRTLPRLSLFGQGGYGRPALNMLDNAFDWYYITGARLSWNLGSFYTFTPERKANQAARKINEVQRATYLTNANITVTQYRESIRKFTELIQQDEEIVVLQEEIMKASNAQLENGVISATDYLRSVNAADMARQTQTLHRLQLTQSILEYNDYCTAP
jgi:outer membrane protein TolC